MHIHICPVEITAALMLVQDGIPYIKYSLCTHAQKIKDKINERKKCPAAPENEAERQEVEEELEPIHTHSKECCKKSV